MQNMDRDDDRIDRFLQGSMSEDELLAFEDEMRSNPILRDEVRDKRDLITVLKASEQVAIKEELKSTIQDLKANPSMTPGRIRRLRVVAAVAAGVVLLLFAVLWLRPTSLTELVATYTEEYYPPPSTARDRGDPTPEWERFIRLYSEGHYGEASEIYSNRAREELKVEEQFYLGLCNIYRMPPNPAEAIDLLSSVKPMSAYYDPAQWYLALSLLQTKQSDQAREVLERIMNGQNWKWQEAEKLLSRI